MFYVYSSQAQITCDFDVSISLDFTTEYIDIAFAGRIKQGRSSENHDHLYDRCTFERRSRSSHSIENRKFPSVSVAISVAAQVIIPFLFQTVENLLSY